MVYTADTNRATGQISPVDRTILAKALTQIDQLGANYQAAFPQSIGSLIGERHYSVTSPRFAIPEPPRYSTFLTLRYQDGLTDAIRLVAGRLPAPNGEPLPIATLNFDDDVIAGACITHEGEIRHEGAKKAAG